MPHRGEQSLVVHVESIAFDADELTPFEEQGQIPDLGFAAPGPRRGEIIPAVGMEGAGGDRRAQDQLDLTLAHPRPELLELALLDQVPLEDRRAIDGAGRSEQAEEEWKETHDRRRNPTVNRDEDGTLYGTFSVPRASMRDPVESNDLRKVGLKVTVPRMRILEILSQAEKEGRHLTAEDIYRELLAGGSDIGIATVYRVLTQFEAAGLVAKHHFEGGHAVYELDRGEHHDHMVCVETGRIVEFVSPEIEALQREIAERHGFELEDHSLVLYVRPRRKR